jgi:hypothetical protein
VTGHTPWDQIKRKRHEDIDVERLDPKLREEMINIMAPVIEVMESRYSEVLIAERLVDFITTPLTRYMRETRAEWYQYGYTAADRAAEKKSWCGQCWNIWHLNQCHGFGAPDQCPVCGEDWKQDDLHSNDDEN